MADLSAKGALTRTRRQWLRSIGIVFAIIGGTSGTLGLLFGLVWSAGVHAVEPYYGGRLPHGSPIGGLAFGAGLGLASAVVWGYIGRPRHVTRSPAGIGQHQAVARLWTGSADPADDGTADHDEPAVTP